MPNRQLSNRQRSDRRSNSQQPFDHPTLSAAPVAPDAATSAAPQAAAPVPPVPHDAARENTTPVPRDAARENATPDPRVATQLDAPSVATAAPSGAPGASVAAFGAPDASAALSVAPDARVAASAAPHASANAAVAPPPPRRRRRMRYATVGEDITVPPQVASDGRLRIRTLRAAQVAKWFRLRPYNEKAAAAAALAAAIVSATAGAKPHRKAYKPLAPPPLPRLLPGTITLITGPSGAGKSSLLRATQQKLTDEEPGRPWIDLAALDLPSDLPLVDCFDDLPLKETLRLLSRVGLGEAWSYLRPPAQLSEGQRWRYRLARGLHVAAQQVAAAEATAGKPGVCFPILLCDEFAAVLDRITALVVSRCLRLSIGALPQLSAVVATSHDDLQPALDPDSLIYCDFGQFAVRGIDDWR